MNLNKLLFASVFMMSLATGYGQQCVTASSIGPTNNICPWDTVFLSSSYIDACFTDSIQMPGYCINHTDSTSLSYQSQTGSPTYAKSIYGNYYKGYRFQFLYTASELAAVFGSGYITELAWRIAAFNSNATLENFAISLKLIPADSTILTDWQTGMTLVWGPQDYTPNTLAHKPGWSPSHTLTTPFYWDGVSNLLVEIRHFNPYTFSNFVNMMSVTADTGKVLYAISSIDVYAQQTPPTPWHEKPLMRMNVCTPDTSTSWIDTAFSMYWVSSGGNAVQYNPSGDAFAIPTTNQSYTAYVKKNGILKASNPVPTYLINISIPTIYHTDNGMLCRGYNYSMAATGYDSYLWSNGDTTSLISVSDTGYYSVQVSKLGCNSVKSFDTVHVQYYANQDVSITLTSGSSLGTNYLAAYPDTALAYWLHRTYDTINGQIYVTYKTTSRDTLICWKDSSSIFTSNFVRYVVRSKYGCSDTTDWVELENCLTGITNTGAQATFSVKPNPFSTQLTFTLTNNEQATVSLYNLFGQQVLQKAFTNSTTVNTELLISGIYFYELRNHKGVIKTGKVVKE